MNHDVHTPLVKIVNISKTINSRILWSDINLEIYPGEFTIIIGENGMGKSTLMHCILGLERVNSGTIITPPTKSILTQLKPEKPLLAITGRQLISTAAKTTQRTPDQLMQAITMVNAEGFCDKRIDNLSGGQWQRIRIAASIINNPQLLACDEPFTGLDIQSMHMIIHELDQWRKMHNSSIIMISHDISHLLPICDHIFRLSDMHLTEISREEALCHD